MFAKSVQEEARQLAEKEPGKDLGIYEGQESFLWSKGAD